MASTGCFPGRGSECLVPSACTTLCSWKKRSGEEMMGEKPESSDHGRNFHVVVCESSLLGGWSSLSFMAFLQERVSGPAKGWPNNPFPRMIFTVFHSTHAKAVLLAAEKPNKP